MFGEHTSTILMVAGVALVALVLLRGRFGRRASAAPSRVGSARQASSREMVGTAHPTSRDAALSDAPHELLRWQVEMHETARDLKAELDSKLSALQTLVAMARRERELLEQTIERANRKSIDLAGGALAAIEGLGDSAALDDPERLGEVAAAIDSLTADVPADLFERDRHSLSIGRLADRGLSPSTIADELKLPVGDVELLMSLRPT